MFAVEKCLQTFRVILPREIALNFMIVWYRSRNAPGTQDISSEQEWKLFLEILLRMYYVLVHHEHYSIRILRVLINALKFTGLLGYDISNVPLIQNLSGNQLDLPTVAKKKKEADVGSDSVK